MDENRDNQAPATESDAAPVPAADPVRKWTFIIAGICVVLIGWYLLADRHTPYTSQARVHALVVPIAPEISGTVADVFVTNNQNVSAGDELLKIDDTRYRLTVETAEADLQSARQSAGASEAAVAAAEAAVGAAVASKVRAERDAERMQRIRDADPGAISQRRLDSAIAAQTVAEKQVESAQANLRKAQQDLGETGEQNVRVLQARSALDQAMVNLQRTTIRAPVDGLVTDVRVERGNFAAAGAPQMTFIAINDIWVQADLTENNLGHIAAGNDVDIAFDALPGKVYTGRVRSIGHGVAVDSAPLGALPTINNDRQWLRDAQRFPVVIDISAVAADERSALRVGSQASVTVYTGGSWILNAIAWLHIRLASLLSYAY